MEVLIFSARLIHDRPNCIPINYSVSLTSDERRKSIIAFVSEGITEEREIRLQLFGNHPRGTILKHGNTLLIEETEEVVQIFAKPESVMTAVATDVFMLLRSAYHLGNRHVPIEITTDWLRFQPDPVLKDMLEQMGLVVSEQIVPFHPEAGAYHRH